LPSQREFEVFSDGHGIIEGGALKKEPNLFAQVDELLIPKFRNILPKDGKPPLIMVDQSHYTFDEYRFAGSGLAKNNKAFAFVNNQVNIPQHRVVSKRFLEMFHLNDNTTVMRAVMS
jgi:hypothetical protein